MNHNWNSNDLASYDNIGSKIDKTLLEVDYKALFSMADWHEKQSTILRSRAQKLAEREHMERQSQLRVEFLKNLHKVVMRYIKQGHTADHACKLAADHTGVRLTTVKYRWKEFLDDKHQKAVKQRNALAYELHSIGYSNVNIADRLSLHAVTVSRILKAEKEKRFKVNNPNRLKLFSEYKSDNVFSISSVQV